jgi:hypothetical protein
MVAAAHAQEYDISGLIDANGIVLRTIEVQSGDQLSALRIREGTQAITADNLPLQRFSIQPLSKAPQVGEGLSLVSTAYVLEPAGARFVPPAVLVLAFDPADLPPRTAPENLSLGYWDPEQKQWLEMGGTADPESSELIGDIGHFSVYAVIAPVSSFNARWIVWGGCAVALLGLVAVGYRGRRSRRASDAAATASAAGEAGISLLGDEAPQEAIAEGDHVITLIEGQDYRRLPNVAPASGANGGASDPQLPGSAQQQKPRRETRPRRGLHVSFSIDFGGDPAEKSADPRGQE